MKQADNRLPLWLARLARVAPHVAQASKATATLLLQSTACRDRQPTKRISLSHNAAAATVAATIGFESETTEARIAAQARSIHVPSREEVGDHRAR
jgi:hypothetical protein